MTYAQDLSSSLEELGCPDLRRTYALEELGCPDLRQAIVGVSVLVSSCLSPCKNLTFRLELNSGQFEIRLLLFLAGVDQPRALRGGWGIPQEYVNPGGLVP